MTKVKRFLNKKTTIIASMLLTILVIVGIKKGLNMVLNLLKKKTVIISILIILIRRDLLRLFWKEMRYLLALVRKAV